MPIITIRTRNELVHTKGGRMDSINKPKKETIAAITDLSPTAYVLLDYFYSVKSGWVFIEKKMTKTLGVTSRTLQKAKRELVQKGYLYIAKGGEITTYYVGKGAVNEFLSSPTMVIKTGQNNCTKTSSTP